MSHNKKIYLQNPNPIIYLSEETVEIGCMIDLIWWEAYILIYLHSLLGAFFTLTVHM